MQVWSNEVSDMTTPLVVVARGMSKVQSFSNWYSNETLEHEVFKTNERSEFVSVEYI